jgi:hypothetical protein
MFKEIRTSPPDAMVIDLTRMPSHGRYVAFSMRQSPKTRQVPVVLVDGDPDKVAITKRQVPDMFFTTRAKLLTTIKAAQKQRLANPIAPWPLVQLSPAHRRAEDGHREGCTNRA